MENSNEKNEAINPFNRDFDSYIRFLHRQGMGVNSIVLDLCYDEDFCREHRISYRGITAGDMAKIRTYVMGVLSKKE